jgi:hypothetical protein
VVPDYAPTGDDAEWRKQGAAALTLDDAAAEAAKAEATLDTAVAELEAKKAADAAAPKKK